MVKIDGQIPHRGDILRLELDPRTGSEQAGYRPVIVISLLAYNQVSKLILICPITSRQKGWLFEVVLPDRMKTYGVILVDQVRTVDCVARGAEFVEAASPELIDEVMAKLQTLVT